MSQNIVKKKENVNVLFDKQDEFKNLFNAFFKPGEVTEIRAITLNGTVESYFFNDHFKFAMSAYKLNTKAIYKGIYFVLNPVQPDLIKDIHTTKDIHVTCHRWLLIDADPVRPSNISATDEEKLQAEICINEIKTFLKENNFPEPLFCDSGNGYHLLYRLDDLPNDKNTTTLKKQALQALHKQFGGVGVHIDQVVYNPSRITKLYGTWARKGSDTPERPHRLSSIISAPDPVEVVTLGQLTWLASLAPKKEDTKEPRTHTATTLGRMNVEAYLSHYNIGIVKTEDKNGSTFHCLKNCIFNPEHKDNEAAICQANDGKLFYQCFHNSCKNKKWEDARQVISGSDILASFCEGYNKEKVWEKPVLLEETQAPGFKNDLLPGVLGEITKAISIATETPLELAAGLVLPVLSTACQGKFIVQVNLDHDEPVNTWVIVALDSGNRKSSVLKKITRPLNEWEKVKRKEFEPVIKKANSILQNQQARIKSLRGQYGKSKPDQLEKIETQLLDIETDIIEVPSYPQTWTQDVTTERLGSLMADNNGKMSILSAEGGIFDIIAGRYSNGIPNLDLYLQGHSGDSVRVDRGSRDPVWIDKPALTLGLSPQPEVLKGLADQPGFRGKGLLARFLYLLPTSTLGYRTLETEPIPQNIEKEYCELIFSLLDIEPQTNERNEVTPYILRLSNEAYQEWLKFSRVIEIELREGGKFENIRDWASKLAGETARIAGLLHCAQKPFQPWSERISLETMNRVLELASIFSSHALIAFDMMGADKSLDAARKVWRWVERNKCQTFSKRDCFNALRGTFHKVVNMDEAFKILQERNYIQEIKQDTGGRPTIIFNVNPEFLAEIKKELFEVYPQKAQKVKRPELQEAFADIADIAYSF